MKAMKAGITLSMLSVLFPLSTAKVSFIQITEPLHVTAQKTHPPYIAHQEVERVPQPDEWDELSKHPAQTLGTGIELEAMQVSSDETPILTAESTERIQLEPMRISKVPNMTVPQQVADDDGEWIQKLPRQQQLLLNQAQRDRDVLNEDWSVNDWAEEAHQIVQQEVQKLNEEVTSAPVKAIATAGHAPAGFVAQASRPTLPVLPGVSEAARPTTPVSSPREADRATSGPSNTLASARSVGGQANAGSNGGARTLSGIDIDPDSSVLELTGPLELQGVGYTNEHSFELRRRQEGIDQEQGQVNIRQGTYSIRTLSRSGDVVARMRDAKGRILGEASFRMVDIQALRGRVNGPKMVLRPRVDFGGRVSNHYDPSRAPAQWSAEIFQGASKIAFNKTGEFDVESVEKGSQTLLRARAPGFLPSTSILTSGSRKDLFLYPIKMVAALKSLVSEQRQMSLDDPAAALIWGRVIQDGKTLGGVKVEIEGAEDQEAVYFNELLLPDPNLKVTSSNGYFAFINAPVGFQALLARRGEAYYGHANVITERGSVATGDILTTLRTENTTIRVYDAFTGEPQPAQVLHQSSEETLEINASGNSSILLPALSRMSMMQVRPDMPYLAATMVANDADGYLHVPLVRADWLQQVRSSLRMDDLPDTGAIVGFVTDENFKASLLTAETNGTRIVYFDPEGRPLSGDHGVAGGGFILFNVSPELHEVVVEGLQSGLISSRMLPMDPRAVGVLLFKAE